MATKRDYYDVLGVNKSASDAELKAAYRKQALQWHPDRNKSPEAETKFKEVNEAYEILSNSEKRAAYDQYGHAAFEQGGMGGGNPFSGGSPFGGQGGGTYQQGPFTYTYYTNGGQGGSAEDFDFSDPFEIFEQFFGGASPFGGRQQQRMAHYSLSISFMEAVKGIEKDVEIGGKEKRIKIPPGVDDGSRIKFEDFYLTLDVKPDKVFKREGDDVIINVDLPFTLAILGGEVDVPTVDGNLKLKIRPGTQPGTVMRLGARGIKHLRGSGRGDEYIRLNVKLPEKLTKKQKELLEEFDGKREDKGWF